MEGDVRKILRENLAEKWVWERDVGGGCGRGCGRGVGGLWRIVWEDL